MGGGRAVQEGGHISVPGADFMLMYGRDQHDTVKQLSSKGGGDLSKKKEKTGTDFLQQCGFLLYCAYSDFHLKPSLDVLVYASVCVCVLTMLAISIQCCLRRLSMQIISPLL